MAETRGPRVFRAGELRFSVLLLARHEETVIFETIRKLTAVDYSSS